MTQFKLSLSDPNTLLPHRAGIAGLALALSALNREDAPLTWQVGEDGVDLAWEGSDRAAVEWLLSQTYQIKKGYLHIPALQLDLQGRYTFTQGLTSTLLQHNQQRKLDSATAINFTIDEQEISLSHRPLLSCYYTGSHKDAFASNGKFKPKIAVKGHHLPGLVECFMNGPYQESPEGFLALLFLPLACGFYHLPGYRSALVIPEVRHLQQWVKYRQKFRGCSYKQFRASSGGESGLRFLLQEQPLDDSRLFKVDYCEVYQLGSQIWDGNQKYLKQAVYRVKVKSEVLKIYKSATELFESVCRKNKNGEAFLSYSVVLPWIADNLVKGLQWYQGFFDFFKKEHNKLYERKGLIEMTKTHLLDEEKLLFEAVQGAFGYFLHQKFNQAKKQGRSLDYDQVTEKVIYRLQRPHTQQEFATALVDFLSQYRSKAAKGLGLEIYAWLYGEEHWRKARDLALLAIATYQSKGKNAENTTDPADLDSDPEAFSDDGEGVDYNYE